MRSFKKEIVAIQRDFNASRKAHIHLCSHKDKSWGNAIAYCTVDRVPDVYVHCEYYGRLTLLTLLHEIGHVLDHSRSPKRFKLIDPWEDLSSTWKGKSKITKRVIYALAYTEYKPSNIMISLIKKYHLESLLDLSIVYHEQAYDVIRILWEVHHEKNSPNSYRKKFRTVAKKLYPLGTKIPVSDIRLLSNKGYFERTVGNLLEKL
jgi:hypothetical protein